MNLSLGLTELAPRGGLEASVARFEQWMAMPDSPIRAIRRQPAREAAHAGMPEGLDLTLRAMLEARGIPQLYTHQAAAFRLSSAG